MGKQRQKHNGKTYEYDRPIHHWTEKDLYRIFGAVKKNPQVDPHLLLTVLFDCLFEMLPSFKNWMCMFLALQQALAFLTVSTGLFKLVSKIIKYAKLINEQLVVGWLSRFMKKYAVVSAFCFAIVVTLEFLIDCINYIQTGVFDVNIVTVLQNHICKESENQHSFFEEEIIKVSQAMAAAGVESLLDDNQGGFDLPPEFGDPANQPMS